MEGHVGKPPFFKSGTNCHVKKIKSSSVTKFWNRSLLSKCHVAHHRTWRCSSIPWRVKVSSKLWREKVHSQIQDFIRYEMTSLRSFGSYTSACFMSWAKPCPAFMSSSYVPASAISPSDMYNTRSDPATNWSWFVTKTRVLFLIAPLMQLLCTSLATCIHSHNLEWRSFGNPSEKCVLVQSFKEAIVQSIVLERIKPYVSLSGMKGFPELFREIMHRHVKVETKKLTNPVCSWTSMQNHIDFSNSRAGETFHIHTNKH